MSLAPGTRLGPYEIVEVVGSGGMGIIYRAHDDRLRRDVAIKTLPRTIADDPDRMARFQIESRAASALNHPNILTVFDIGTHEGRPYLVTELLEGRSLRACLDESPVVPLRKALDWTAQIATGLAVAHERKIVHRDVKPENIFVCDDGRAVLLDFGLARLAVATDDARTQTTAIPAGATDPGTVLGTVGYMSPEQVRSQPVDGRSDIFSLGAALYEMVTGTRAFHRETPAETMTAILREDPAEPSPAGSGASVPPMVLRITRRCLEKNPSERFQSARDLAFALGAAADTASGSTTAESQAVATSWTAGRPRRPQMVAALAGALLAGMALAAGLDRTLLAPARPAPPVIVPLTYSGADSTPAVSPDGRVITFVSTRDGTSRVWLKQVASGEEVALTDGPDHEPRFSPDGSSVLFIRSQAGPGLVLRVPTVGGTPRPVARDAWVADWSPDGTQIAFARSETGQAGDAIYVVPSDGGTETLLARLPSVMALQLAWSPDGRRIVIGTGGRNNVVAEQSVVVVIDAATGSMQTVYQPPIASPVSAPAWDGPEAVVFATSSTQASRGPFLVMRAGTGGEPMPLASLAAMPTAMAVAGPGRIIADGLTRRSELRFFDVPPRGRAMPIDSPGAGGSVDRQPVFSPDGRSLAFSSDRGGNLDIWVMATGTGEVRRLTHDAADDWDPVFTPDSSHILWSSNRSGPFEIWMANADGTGARQVTADGEDAENPSLTPDGEWIVYSSAASGRQGLWKVRVDGTAPTRFLAGQYALPELSPDGRWVSAIDMDRLLRVGANPVIKIVRVADGSDVAAFEVPWSGAVGPAQVVPARHRWMPGRAAIAYLGRRPDGATEIAVRAIAHAEIGPADVLATFPADAPAESFGFGPDGRRLVVSVLRKSTDLVMIEGLDGVGGR